MALVACPECGHRVSTQAAACPSCGAPGPAASRGGDGGRGGVGGIGGDAVGKVALGIGAWLIAPWLVRLLVGIVLFGGFLGLMALLVLKG